MKFDFSFLHLYVIFDASFVFHFIGLGYAMVAVSGIVCIYYNVIMAWALYYMFHSFTTGELPWATCGNWWNTPQCRRRTHYHLDLSNTSNITDQVTTSAPTLSEVSTLALNITKNVTTPAEEFWQ